MLRLHVLPESDLDGNPHGSSHIRLLLPLAHPAIAESFRLTCGDTLPPGGVDIAIVERGWRADTTLESARKLVKTIRASGAKLLYTLDDNLPDLHRHQPWHESSAGAKRNVAGYFLRHADGVIVSTPALRERLRKLNPSIQVVPNALDEGLFLPPPRMQANARLTIGYMGTHSHLDDLLMVLEALRAVLNKFQDGIEFQMVGISNDDRLAQCFAPGTLRVLDTAGRHFYPDFVPWAKRNLNWDLAIAPLEDNDFTRCKSDIKFLDYAMLGIPGIYSNVEAYRHSVRSGETGWLCDNTPQAWRAALEQAIEDSRLRRNIASSAFEYASNHRTLRHCAENWKRAVLALSGRNIQAGAETGFSVNPSSSNAAASKASRATTP